MSEIDLSKWWGPYRLHEPVNGNPPPLELRCGFCKLPPLVGNDVIGIADLVVHADFQICMDMVDLGFVDKFNSEYGIGK